jgi:hypothetical protein
MASSIAAPLASLVRVVVANLLAHNRFEDQRVIKNLFLGMRVRAPEAKLTMVYNLSSWALS